VTADGSRSVLEADAVCLSTGPWGCMAEDWFPTISSPMEGIKSTSVTFPARETANDAVALFCNEDSRFNTHLEVYVRAKRAPILTCNDAGPSEHPLLARAPTPICLAATIQGRASIRCWRERPPRTVSLQRSRTERASVVGASAHPDMFPSTCATSPAAGGVRGVSPRHPEILPASATNEQIRVRVDAGYRRGSREEERGGAAEGKTPSTPPQPACARVRSVARTLHAHALCALLMCHS
jgi:glycine/D-amino acid oxidase-like deaminating enzyme